MISDHDTFAIVTGGGTAGHVLPALAVAEALTASGHDPGTIHYVGSERGIETRLLPASPYPHTFLDVTGFQRSITPRNLGFPPRMIASTSRALRLVNQLKPKVVVSVGGYASLPAVFAARRLKIPVVVISYDRTPGRASKLASRRAAACAVAFEGSPLPRATVTGAPVRQAILDVDRQRDRSAARVALQIPDHCFLVSVVGGSLGSGLLNEAVAAYARDHRADSALAIYQIAGERFVNEIEQQVGGIVHRVVGYEADMAAVYAASDLVVGRGGASTVHEIAVTGTPSILVPWGAAADDHQTDNVAWLAEVGGAILLPESQLGALGDHIESLRAADSARRALGTNAATRGQVHRSGALADLIERVASNLQTP